jgi:hypothetical protein
VNQSVHKWCSVFSVPLFSSKTSPPPEWNPCVLSSSVAFWCRYSANAGQYCTARDAMHIAEPHDTSHGRSTAAPDLFTPDARREDAFPCYGPVFHAPTNNSVDITSPCIHHRWKHKPCVPIASKNERMGAFKMSLRTGCWGEYMDLTGRKWRENGEDYIMWSFIAYTLHQILLGESSQGGWDWRWM